MEPVRALLGNTNHFLIAPDGQLNLIPFSTLIDENGDYLVQNYLITELTGGRDLLKLQNPVSPRSSSVIVANPDYGATRSQVAGVYFGSNRGSLDLAKLDWCCKPLPGTAAEADAIKPLLPEVKLFTEASTTIDVIKKVSAPRILHLATHGFFLEDQETDTPPIPNTLDSSLEKVVIAGENPLLRSGLAFAGFNPRNDKFDGALTALEATSLDLWGTKLVVLSACKTGVGDV